MGIPGLQRQANELAATHRAPFFAGGDFYIDGLNFAHRIASRSDPSGTRERPRPGKKLRGHALKTPHERGAMIADAQILMLSKLNPHSITFVFDAMIGIEKFAVRIARTEAILRKAEGRASASGILAERILRRHKHVRLVYSGTEAEDEIMKLIDEDESRGTRRQFVFSSDSDVFRFNIHHPETVEIVPLEGQKFSGKKPITTINLKAALDANIVPKKMRVFPPIERLGVSTINPTVTSRKFLEFVNCGIVYHRFFLSLGPLLVHGHDTAPGGVNPYDAGHEIRRAAYGYTMNRFFKNRPDVDTSRVEEWRQNGVKMEPIVVEPLQGETLRLALKALEVSSLAKIVENQLEEVARKYGITKREISGIALMISELKSGGSRRRPVNAVTDRTHRLFVIVKAIIESVMFLDQALNTRPEIESLDMQLSPHHMQAYLPRAGSAKVPNAYLSKLTLQHSHAPPPPPVAHHTSQVGDTQSV